jgi:CRISPR-associated endonuclease/helicase Cas3
MLNHIIAKKVPRETLIEHTDEIVKRWKKLEVRYKGKIPVDDSFWKYSFLSALFHDTGKVALNFQEKIQDEVNNFDDYIRHEMLSGIFLLFGDKEYFLENPSALLAVFSHHKPLVDGKLFLREKDRILRVHEADLKVIVGYLKKKMEEKKIYFEFNEQLIGLFAKPTPLDSFYVMIKEYLLNSGLLFLKQGQKCRREYIFYKAILNTADWTASGHQELGIGFPFSSKTLEEKVIEKLVGERKVVDKFSWKKFQSDCLSQPENVLAIAPTGSGKTEAALLWASQKEETEKIIYLLPTRVTSNSIYERLCKYFTKDHTAVVHSSAFFYQKDLDDSGNYHKGNYLVDKTFFKNVSVCTIDQVLTQGFNIGYWEIKTFNMLNAWVVIDEIHLYSPYTLGLIVSTIKYLKKEFGTRFFIMTATMPSKLQVILKNTLEIDESCVVRDHQLLEEARNVFEVRDVLVDKLEKEIKKELEAKKKVLIVVNTVDEAIRLYEKFDGIAGKTICYHSRFIQRDRLKKEQEILKFEKEATSLLLIATQVVEVSLDIDFDILFSENAPIDAIIQRAGRVNRGRKKKGTKIIIFKEQDVTRDVIYTEVDGILENTFEELKKRNGQRLTENELIKLVDKIYESYNVEEHPRYIEALSLYETIQRKNHYVKDNDEKGEVYTREGLDSESVIPYQFYETLRNAEPSEIAKHEVSLRTKKLKTLIWKGEFSYLKEDYYQYLGCKYSYEIGFELDKFYDQKSTF